MSSRHKRTQHVGHNILAVDRNFIPMNVTTRRRSLKALLAGKAQILDLRTFERRDFTRDVLTTPFQVIVYPHTQAIPESRIGMGGGGASVLRRDGHVCQYDNCHNRAGTVDHVIPRCQGGLSTWMNLVACCFECNQKKGPLTPEQAGMKLKRKPTSPRGILIQKFQDMCSRAAA